MAGMSCASPLGRDMGARGGARGALGSETGIPRRLGLLTPKSAIFYRISVEVGQFQSPLEIQNSHPPLIFRDLTPPIPVSNWQTLV